MNKEKSLPNLPSRLGLGFLYLVLGLLVFVLGSNYYVITWTNQSQLYRVILALFLLASALLTRQNSNLKIYSHVLYAFFIGITTYFLTSWFAIYRDPILISWGIELDSDLYLAVIKLMEAGIVIGAILILSALWGTKFREMYLRKGRLGLSLFIGLCLFLINAATALMVGAVRGETGDFLMARLPWALVYSLANSCMEELLFRGLFLGRVKRIFGPWGAMILTSLIFTVMHSAASYLNFIEAMIFQLVLFPMAMLLAYLIQKTDNLWGSILYHSGSDVFLFYLLEF